MDTFTCDNCNKAFPISERGKLHWALNLGALLLLLGTWFPSNLCFDCRAKLTIAGIVGLLIATALAVGILLNVKLDIG